MENDVFYVMNVDGTDMRRLNLNYTGSSQPAWSPDGSRIVFQSLGDSFNDGFALHIIEANGSYPRRIFGTEKLDLPQFSPDGTKILCHGGGTGSNDLGDIFLVDLNDLSKTKIASNASEPCFSPDGTRIAFMHSKAKGMPDLCVMDADGSNIVKLTDGTFWVDHPTFSPDGSRIAFGMGLFNGGAIASISVTGGDPVILTLHGGAPSWGKSPSP